MVDSQIVEEEKDLLVRGFGQLLEKLEQSLCIHGATVNHKTHVAPVGPVEIIFLEARFADSRITGGWPLGAYLRPCLAVIAHPRLIAPMNLGCSCLARAALAG